MNCVLIRITNQSTCKSFSGHMHGVRAMWGKKSRRGVQIGEYRPHTYIGYLATTQLGSSTGRIASEVTGVEVTRAPELTVLLASRGERGKIRSSPSPPGVCKAVSVWGSRTAHTYDPRMISSPELKHTQAPAPTGSHGNKVHRSGVHNEGDMMPPCDK